MPVRCLLKYVKGSVSVLVIQFWSIVVLLAPRCASAVIHVPNTFLRADRFSINMWSGLC
jgi:hypothetical protein